MTITSTAPRHSVAWATGLIGAVLGEPRSEWNHSCTAQCPADCDAARNMINRPESDTAPVVTC